MLPHVIRQSLAGAFKQPAAALAIIVTLAAALGVNAGLFAIFDALVLRPFSASGLDSAIYLTETRADSQRRDAVSPANFLEWQRRARTLTAFSAFTGRPVEVGHDDEPARLQASFVTPELMRQAQLVPARGRLFGAEEAVTGRDRVAVLSHRIWTSRFAADPAIVGRQLTLDGLPYDVIGVAPEQFDLPAGTDLWAPLALDSLTPEARYTRTLAVIARLAPGASLPAARAEMTALAAQLAQEDPDHNANRSVRVETLTAGLRDDGLGPVLALAQLAGIVVLLIACVNLGNLLIALGADRQQEVSIRLALGATRGRVFAGLWLETVLLALLAVPFAIGVAFVAIRLVTTSTPAAITRFVPGWSGIGLDLRLVLATIALALLSAVFFGLLPAFQASRPNPQALRAGRQQTPDAARLRLRRALIVTQVALVLPLLVMAGIAARGAARYVHGPQGYEPSGLIATRVFLVPQRYPDAQAQRQFGTGLLERLAAERDVRAAAVVNFLPASGMNPERIVEIEGQAATRAGRRPSASFRAVSPGYFDTMRIPLIKGRAFSDVDREDAPPVAIISRSMAEMYWPGVDPLGRRFRSNPDADATWVTVVGVAGDVIHDWYLARNPPTFYRPYAQDPVRNVSLVVRAAGSADVTGQVRGAIQAVDATRPMDELRTLEQMLGDRLAGLRQVAVVMAILGALALLLATVGLYGVISYSVAQRTQEISLRAALGATHRDVLRLVMGQMLRLTGAGVLIGLLLAAAIARTMEATMFGAARLDVGMLGGAALIVAALGALAGYLPARRALAIPPTLALRGQ